MIAAPVAPRASCAMLRKVADEVVCLIEAEDFFAIGQWYEDFSQLADEDTQIVLGSVWGLISAA